MRKVEEVRLRIHDVLCIVEILGAMTTHEPAEFLNNNVLRTLDNGGNICKRIALRLAKRD